MKKKKLNELISLQNLTEDYGSGDLVVTNTTVQQFWGDIKQERSPSVVGGTYSTNRERDRYIINITARSRDTEDVIVGSELTFDSVDGTYSVSDKYDVDFKHYVMIVAELIN